MDLLVRVGYNHRHLHCKLTGTEQEPKWNGKGPRWQRRVYRRVGALHRAVLELLRRPKSPPSEPVKAAHEAVKLLVLGFV